MVLRGLVTACRRATSPTSRSPVFENATTDGVVRNPSALAMTLGSPPSMIATQELVVPRSIPITLPIPFFLSTQPHARPIGDSPTGACAGPDSGLADLNL